MKNALFKGMFFLFILGTCIINAQNKTETIIADIFANPPDSTPKIFAKGVISIADRYEYGLAISPDWDEIFFTAEGPGEGLLRMGKQNNGNWTAPAVANLRGNNSWEFEAFFSPDKRLLFFSSPLQDTSRIWISIRKGNKWGKAVILDSQINDAPVFWSTISENGTLYYTNLTARKIFSSQMNNQGRFDEFGDAGLPYGIHPFISKDESYILFNYRGDIYAAFKGKDSFWKEPVKLGSNVNTTEFNETCPTLSPDEKYLFFSRYNDLNNKCDIYWVNASVIKILKNRY